MNYGYRLEDVDPKITEELKKEKEAQRERQRKAWEVERQKYAAGSAGATAAELGLG
jgi:hypothetical protein